MNAVAVLIGAIAVGRTIGFLVDGFDETMALLIGIEIAMVAVAPPEPQTGVTSSRES